MPKPSLRSAAMPSSPIRRLVEFAIAAEAKGTHVHYLNIGQPDVATPQSFWDAVQHAHIQTLEYSHSAGILPLREAAAAHYRSRGIPVETSDVMVTTGGSEATQFVFQTCFDRGDELIVVEPFYANYLGFAKASGVTLVPLTTRIEHDFRLPSGKDIEAKITPKTKGILICNPSNPTGTVFSPETLRELGALAKQRNLFLILDEVYRDFYYGGEDLFSVLEIPGLEENAIMLDSASKKFSLCGARIGFLVTKNHHVLSSALKFAQTRLASPTLDQLGVTSCLLNTPDEYFTEVRGEYVSRRDLVVSRLKNMPGVLCPRIDGAFYAIVRLPVEDSDHFCEWLVSSYIYQGETVLLAPATGFYATPGLGKDEVRIAYVLDKSRLDRAMHILQQALISYPATKQAILA